MIIWKNYLISAATSTPTIHGLVRLVRSYSLRRDSIEDQSYYFRRNDRGPDDGAVDLKLILELSLNALVRLILHLQAGNSISYTDLALIRVIVPELVDCAISEIFSMLRSRCTSYHNNMWFCSLKIYFRFRSRNFMLLWSSCSPQSSGSCLRRIGRSDSILALCKPDIIMFRVGSWARHQLFRSLHHSWSCSEWPSADLSNI